MTRAKEMKPLDLVDFIPKWSGTPPAAEGEPETEEEAQVKRDSLREKFARAFGAFGGGKDK